MRSQVVQVGHRGSAKCAWRSEGIHGLELLVGGHVIPAGHEMRVASGTDSQQEDAC